MKGWSVLSVRTLKWNSIKDPNYKAKYLYNLIQEKTGYKVTQLLSLRKASTPHTDLTEQERQSEQNDVHDGALASDEASNPLTPQRHDDEQFLSSVEAPDRSLLSESEDLSGSCIEKISGSFRSLSYRIRHRGRRLGCSVIPRRQTVFY